MCSGSQAASARLDGRLRRAGDDVVAGLGRGDAHIAESSGAEQLAGFLDLGFSTLNLMPQGPDIADQTEILATEVIPALRS